MARYHRGKLRRPPVGWESDLRREGGWTPAEPAVPKKPSTQKTLSFFTPKMFEKKK